MPERYAITEAGRAALAREPLTHASTDERWAKMLADLQQLPADTSVPVPAGDLVALCRDWVRAYGVAPHPITARETELLQFIGRYIRRAGYAPTYDEMCAGIACRSPSSVYELVAGLRSKGWIKKGRARRARWIELTPAADRWIRERLEGAAA